MFLPKSACQKVLPRSTDSPKCKVLQIDGELEEIMETSSYFADRAQEVLEVLNARMARLEGNAETPVGLPSKNHQAL